mmetsp:Transcript_10734/g.11703  ORF Transcript_10734/g.11703 Transcript_10734/m.11703 type:complete len:85 (+) Transcript_10734:581-835(+)
MESQEILPMMKEFDLANRSSTLLSMSGYIHPFKDFGIVECSQTPKFYHSIFSNRENSLVWIYFDLLNWRALRGKKTFGQIFMVP